MAQYKNPKTGEVTADVTDDKLAAILEQGGYVKVTDAEAKAAAEKTADTVTEPSTLAEQGAYNAEQEKKAEAAAKASETQAAKTQTPSPSPASKTSSTSAKE